MKKTLLLILFLGIGITLQAQSGPDSLRRADEPWTDPAGPVAELPDEEDYAAWFLPAVTGNGNYLPMGQLARNLIGLRFRPRGYEYRYQAYEVNGIELSDPTDGYPYWNIIAAVNLMPRSHNDVSGLSPGEYGPGGIGGVASVSLTDRFIPSDTRISYALTNRTYRHRATASFREMLGKGWGLSAGISGRGGRDGFVDGISSRRWDASGTVFKRVGDHTFSLLLAATESEQGVRSAATQEVYDLARTNYYNPNWGYQNGEMRNSKERTYRQAFSALSWQGQLDDRWSAQAGLSIFGGENAYSLPAWYDAPTLYADYYRSLPGFYSNTETANILRQEWFGGNTDITQINWRNLYEANKYNLDANGIARSHYVIREGVTDKRNLQANVSFHYRHTSALSFRGGFRFRYDRSTHYSRMKDLLGGSYWLDIDQYLLDDEYYGGMYQNNMQNPDRPIFEGEKFGYNYRMRSNNVKAWGVAEYKTAAWNVFAGIEAGTVDLQREGFYEKELFPGDLSLGLSEKVRFPEYTVKAGAFYHLSLRHRIGVQGMVGAKAPLVKNIFVAPDYRNETLGEWNTVRITSGEIVYQWNSPELKVDVAGYATLFRDDSESRNYYDDVSGEYLNFAMTGIDKLHAGAEIGAEWNVTAHFSVLGVLSLNAYKYVNDPSVTLYRDSDGEVVAAGETAYLDGLRLAGTPQTAAMLQLAYRTRSAWRFELSAKQTAHNYVSVNPVRRMNRALDLAGSAEAAAGMTEQERLDDAFLLGLSVSKTFRLPNGHRIGLWINADNLLDNRSIRYSGYEQWRFSGHTANGARTLAPFPSKYYYAYGANFYAQISYSF